MGVGTEGGEDCEGGAGAGAEGEWGCHVGLRGRGFERIECALEGVGWVTGVGALVILRGEAG